MAYRNFYNFHRITFKKYIYKLEKNLRNFQFYHFSKIVAALEIFDFDICLLLLLEISLLYIKYVQRKKRSIHCLVYSTAEILLFKTKVNSAQRKPDSLPTRSRCIHF